MQDDQYGRGHLGLRQSHNYTECKLQPNCWRNCGELYKMVTCTIILLALQVGHLMAIKTIVQTRRHVNTHVHYIYTKCTLHVHSQDEGVTYTSDTVATNSINLGLGTQANQSKLP